ncbi:MAG: type III pantothenate kinase [Ruminococcaceae bacterium]|nr:type III pantothenate kinase [Oscillospiraceae bacterium]
MLLAIDVGNTNISLGVFDQEVLRTTARLATSKEKTADEYAVDLMNVLSLHGEDVSKIEDCIISSVVPSVSASVSSAVAFLCDTVPLMVGPGVKTGLNIKIDNPAQLGADLVTGAVAALNEYTLPCIIIDMGTATTLSVLDRNGAFLGGTIGAGMRMTFNALAEGTAALPSVSITAPKSVIGKNTVDCMQSGIVLGTAAMLDGLIDRIEEELGERATVVATGGLSREVISYCKNDIIYNENLLLDGLRLIYEKNN